LLFTFTLKKIIEINCNNNDLLTTIGYDHGGVLLLHVVSAVLALLKNAQPPKR
jgi:hypothetical protein